MFGKQPLWKSILIAGLFYHNPITATADTGTGKADTSQVVMLTTQRTAASRNRVENRILMRELVRQAVLIAARDGLGLSTRDMSLREFSSPQTSEPNEPFDCEAAIISGKKINIRLRRNEGEGKTWKWQKEVPLPAGPVNYLHVVELMEKLSRKEFVEAFQQAGFQGKPNVINPSAKLPVAVEKLLGEMNFIAQYAALREIHAVIRANGESPVLLGGLVRGYSNLGLLTECHWNSSHKVCKARSLLYAQRMMSGAPDSAEPRWYRAYALAATGLHEAALRDLEEASKLAEQRSGSISLPSWLGLIEAFCKYDFDTLNKTADSDSPETHLARYLAFCDMPAAFNDVAVVKAGREALQRMPDCFSIIDMMSNEGGIRNLHFTTQYGPAILAGSLSTRLGKMPGLPSEVAKQLSASTTAGLLKVIPDKESEKTKARDIAPQNLVESLQAAGQAGRDEGEPSWAFLGQMIEEITFLQLWRRAYLMRDQWDVPTDAFISRALPLIPHHPYRNFIATFRYDRLRQSDEIHELLKDMDIVDSDYRMEKMINALRKSSPEDQEPPPSESQEDSVYELMAIHNDMIVRDIERRYIYHRRSKNTRYRVLRAKELHKVSPFSPFAIAALIRDDWEFAEPHTDEWKKNFGGYQTVIRAFANRYIKLVRFKDAECCLIQYLKISPDYGASEALASIYEQRGQMEKWKETLDAYLETDSDLGLQQVFLQVELAQYLMKQGKYDEAEVYVRRAAPSGASSAMLCAVHCYEGMQLWGAAETWIRKVAERYDCHKYVWYFWCKRTGHGDAEKAFELARNYYESLEGKATDEDLELMGILYTLSAQAPKAIEAFRKNFDHTNNPYTGLHLALLAEAVGDKAVRDAALRQIEQKSGTYQVDHKPRAQMIQLANAFRTVWAGATHVPLDLDVVEKIIASAPEGENTNLLYFVGKFLELQGNKEKARDYLYRCAISSDTYKNNHILARDLLRQQGVKLPQIKADGATLEE